MAGPWRWPSMVVDGFELCSGDPRPFEAFRRAEDLMSLYRPRLKEYEGINRVDPDGRRDIRGRAQRKRAHLTPDRVQRASTTFLSQ
jgi:hypothetical protein